MRLFLQLRLVLLLPLIYLAGCASSLVVKGDYPAPLVTALPIKVAPQYSEKLKNYQYKEKQKRLLKSIDFGDAQVQLFDTVFKSLFSEVVDNPAQVELTLSPEILDFQYSIPRETKLNVYEVWLKYRLLISDAQGNEIADWLIKGYGKTPTATLKSAVAAFNTATNIALRDVGAQIAIGFGKQTAIKDFLKQKQGAQIAANSPEPVVNKSPEAVVENSSERPVEESPERVVEKSEGSLGAEGSKTNQEE